MFTGFKPAQAKAWELENKAKAMFLCVSHGRNGRRKHERARAGREKLKAARNLVTL